MSRLTPNVRIRPHRPFIGDDDPPPVRLGKGVSDVHYREFKTLAEATAQVPGSAEDVIWDFENMKVFAKALPKLDGWQMTGAGDVRHQLEAQ